MTILCYHAVEPGDRTPLSVMPESFRRQMLWLARRRDVVSLPDAVEQVDSSGLLPGRMTAVTFDDGLSSVYEQAWPILRRMGLPATVFVVASSLLEGAQDVHWVSRAAVGERSLHTVTADQLLEMREGGMTVGSHSYAHLDLTSLSEAECQRDLHESRELLEDVLRARVALLAYPFGRHGPAVHRAAARAGFTHAFTLGERRYLGPPTVPRVGIGDADRGAMLWAKTSHWYLAFRETAMFPPLRAMRTRARDL